MTDENATEQNEKVGFKQKIINLYYELKPLIIQWLNNLLNKEKK